MFIEGVTVCVGYDDFLAWSLPLNRHIFDKLVVVTSEEDWHTQNLCRAYKVECIRTNIFKNGKFPKGEAINLGLSRLSRRGFICHFDCDIIFPHRTKEMLEIAQLQQDTIYSALRMNAVGFDEWIKHFIKPRFIHDKEIFVHYNAFPMSPLVSKTYIGDIDFPFEPGFLPIGYAQIWHDNGTPKKYPEGFDGAGGSDMLFSMKNWPKRINRQIIPEIVLIHLVSEDGLEMGANWSGRTSSRFGPNPN